MMLDLKNLQKYSLFGGLTEEQIERVVLRMCVEKYNVGDIIIRQNTHNDKIYFIVAGQVSITRADKLICDLGEGTIFGEMEVLDVMPSAATATAVTDVSVMSISNTALRDIYKRDIKTFTLLLMNLARDLSRRIRIANEIMMDGKVIGSYSSAVFMQR